MDIRRVLIVDDDRDLAESFAEFLELDGFVVRLAFNGRSGVDAALASDFDQVIVDVGLPDIGGIEVADRILATRPETRIILITGYAGEELDRRDGATRSVEVLTKPVDPEALSARVSASVKGQR